MAWASKGQGQTGGRGELSTLRPLALQLWPIKDSQAHTPLEAPAAPQYPGPPSPMLPLEMFPSWAPSLKGQGQRAGSACGTELGPPQSQGCQQPQAWCRAPSFGTLERQGLPGGAQAWPRGSSMWAGGTVAGQGLQASASLWGSGPGYGEGWACSRGSAGWWCRLPEPFSCLKPQAVEAFQDSHFSSS